jgi:hypothetical protein
MALNIFATGHPQAKMQRTGRTVLILAKLKIHFARFLSPCAMTLGAIR